MYNHAACRCAEQINWRRLLNLAGINRTEAAGNLLVKTNASRYRLNHVNQMTRTFIKLVLILGALGPTVLASLGAWGVNQWVLVGALFVYVIALGATAWQLEKRRRWTGVALCFAVLVLGILIVYLTHRRLLR